MKKEWNFKRELARKFVHLLSVFIILIYFVVSDMFNTTVALVILVFMLVFALEFEYLRLETGKKIPVLGEIWKYVRRDKEQDKLGGDVFLLLGAIIVLAIFDTNVAMAAILMTTFGDLSAALIGSKFGKRKVFQNRNKTWAGVFAELTTNILIGIFVFFIFARPEINVVGLIVIILVMAFTATFVETLANKIDDNLLIPIFAGLNGHITLWIVVRYFSMGI